MASFIRSLKDMRWTKGTDNREGYEKSKRSVNRLIKLVGEYEGFDEEYKSLLTLRRKIDDLYNEDCDKGTARFEDVE